MSGKSSTAEDWLLTPAELAAALRVEVTTLARWRRAGRFPDGAVIVTPGGTHRYRASLVLPRFGTAGSAS